MRALCMLCLWCVASAGWAAPRRHALIIGVDEGDPTEQRLHFAVRDAERVAQLLADLGDFAEEDMVLLRGPRAGRVREVLDRLEERLSADPEPGVLLVYYSGHADAGALHLDGTRLPLTELQQRIDDMPAAMRVVVVDACRSGSLTRVKGARQVEPFSIDIRHALQTSGTAMITSSSAGEDAQESDAVGGGVFTHHFLAGLRGAADLSGDRSVTLTEAYRYAYAETLRTTSSAPVVQHPTFSFDTRGKDDLVLTWLSRGEDSATLYLADGGEYLVFDGGRQGRLVTEVHVSDGAVVSLSPGTYLLRRRGPDQAHEATITLVSGSTTDVGMEDLSVVPYGRSVRKGLASGTRVALGISLGGGVNGAMLEGLGAGPIGALGLRADTGAVTLHLRARYGTQGSENVDVSLRQHAWGADLTLARLFDIGPIAPGLGLRAGADAIYQRFETRGDAPPRRAFAPRVGPVVRLEVAPAGRWLLGLEAGADAVFLPGEERIQTRVVPHGAFEVTAYVF